MMSPLSSILWKDDHLLLLDQRKLPHEEVWVRVSTLEDAYMAIYDMVVRGAPCLSFAALWGVVLWIQQQKGPFTLEQWHQTCQKIKEARPTAVNLCYEIERLSLLGEKCFQEGRLGDLLQEAISFTQEQMNLLYKNNLAMAQAAHGELCRRFGSKKLRLLTHCNTGPLACGVPLGTAIGVLSYLHEVGALEHVYVDETRPYLQGSRLTSYELLKYGISHDVVVDGASSYLMRNGLVDAVFVGADRIVANGDTANKVGTSNLAIVSHYYQIPFFVMAPLSSFDLSLPSGDQIAIELRDPEEILSYKGDRIAPKESTALNPSFDVTPGNIVSAFFCEKGLLQLNNEQRLSL